MVARRRSSTVAGILESQTAPAARVMSREKAAYPTLIRTEALLPGTTLDAIGQSA